MKHLSILLAMCMAIFATSCDDNEEVVTTVPFQQIYSVSGSTGYTTLFPETTFTYEIESSESEIDLTISGITFHPNMRPITMEINDVPFSSTSKGFMISGSNIIPEVGDKDMPEYTITSITGQISSSLNASGDICKLSFTINNEFIVNAYSTPLIFEHNSQALVSGDPMSNSVFNYNEAFYAVSFNTDTNTAQIELYNVKFHKNMPVALNLIFKDIPFSTTSNGFEMASESITAVMNNSEQTPMTDYPISNMTATIINDKLELNFDCVILAPGSSVGGITYTVSSSAGLLP